VPRIYHYGVHALFVDFRKAFDLVDHKILQDKLADMNVIQLTVNVAQYSSDPTMHGVRVLRDTKNCSVHCQIYSCFRNPKLPGSICFYFYTIINYA
jgi:hypothetical protein